MTGFEPIGQEGTFLGHVGGIEWDRDGDGTDFDWDTLVIFKNSIADNFTEANFVPGYDPDGDAPPGETIVGTSGDDFLIGTVGGDTIDALGGNDNVFGQAGDDIINGGSGFDTLDGGADDDIIDGGSNEDNITGGEGNDQLLGQAGDDILFGENGNDTLSGGAGDDNLNGEAGDDTLSGGTENDFLSGGDDDDILTGDAGADSLAGGLGADVFDYGSAAEGADEIFDFEAGIDQIQVSASGFGGGLTAGGSVSLVSGSTPTATAATGQFLYDTDDGRLLWDADGTGAAAGAVLIATLSSIPTLAASDFVVV